MGWWVGVSSAVHFTMSMFSHAERIHHLSIPRRRHEAVPTSHCSLFQLDLAVVSATSHSPAGHQKGQVRSRPRISFCIFEGNLSCVYQLGRWTTARCQSKSACIWLLDRTIHPCSLRLHSLWFACKQDSTQHQVTLNSTCGFRTRDVTFDTASPAQPQLAEAQTDLRIGASSTACLKRSTWRQFITGRMAKGNCARVHD